MTDSFMNACRRNTWITQYGVYNYSANHSVLAAAPMRQIIDNMEKAIKNDQFKFSLMSGHDTTLGSILVMLGILDRDVVPQYASHLAVELFTNSEQKFLRFTFNGDVLKIPHFGEELVPYDDFVAFIKPYTYHCEYIPNFDTN